MGTCDRRAPVASTCRARRRSPPGSGPHYCRRPSCFGYVRHSSAHARRGCLSCRRGPGP